ncbi:MAG: 50S ribosomal protein L11 methyltransferase [Saprospiraceae bacterium]|nr:50S ribosomal protein L11 methyltransferase [Saprospiraceae bacterium]MBK8451615.1 50S ribosomal protein L11 methyltransferase [Saprospiraceae bacterium]MBK9722058.1 50S ribosomal protein L11 methyltransferase [Saprospiraceae bacterium]
MACISYYIHLDAAQHEFEIAYLNELGIDSFIEHEDALEAFLETEDTNISAKIESYLKEKQRSFEKRSHQLRDWNKEWESNFDAFSIAKKLLVRAPFHPVDSTFKESLLISPKMAFGTGHHETTSMILEWMLDQNFENKKILDFGCGTGILGIFAAKRKASLVNFIDNDPLSIENTIENIQLNELVPMQCILGSTAQIPNEQYDVILANITRNILSESMELLVSHLFERGIIVISGFLETDLEFMLACLHKFHLKVLNRYQKKDWLCLIAQKQGLPETT